MIIFLYGQDVYRSRQKLNEIIGRYKKIQKNGLNLSYFGGTDLRFEEFKDSFQQVSIFSEKKLIVLSNIFLNQDFKEKFLKNHKAFLESKDVILFYEEGSVSSKDKLFNLLKNKAKTQDFQLLEGEKLKSWIKREFVELKSEVSPDAVNKLIDFIGSDLWFLSNEIAKLANYKRGDKVNIEDVELLTRPKTEAAIFETIDALAQKNKKRAFLLISRHLKKGDNPFYLFSMINFQFRNILTIKDLIEKQKPYYYISKITGLHPFVVKKSFYQANKFTFQELKKIYQNIFQADLDIKTGRIDPENALYLLIAGI